MRSSVSPSSKPQVEPTPNLSDDTDSQRLKQVSAPHEEPEASVTNVQPEVKDSKDLKVTEDIPEPVEVAAIPSTPAAAVTPVTPVSEPKEADSPPSIGSANAPLLPKAAVLPLGPSNLNATSQTVDGQNTSGNSFGVTFNAKASFVCHI